MVIDKRLCSGRGTTGAYAGGRQRDQVHRDGEGGEPKKKIPFKISEWGVAYGPRLGEEASQSPFHQRNQRMGASLSGSQRASCSEPAEGRKPGSFTGKPNLGKGLTLPRTYVKRLSTYGSTSRTYIEQNIFYQE